MKNILCYGDSNTYGFIPNSNGLRYDEQNRWTGVLQFELGNNYEIIEEGACDRNGFVDNPKGMLYSAQKHFPIIVSELKNIDILILALGTNDLQFQYNIDYSVIENKLKNLILIAQRKVDNIILIPPVILEENILDGFFKIQFDKTSIAKSKKVGQIYNKLGKLFNCKIFDINTFSKPSNADGLHYDNNTHKLIGKNLSVFIKNNF